MAVVEGACNECSNCEVYCPEHGAPFQVKERVFLSRADFDRCPDLDGFCRHGDELYARLAGRVFSLRPGSGGERATLSGTGIDLELNWDSLEVVDGTVSGRYG